MEIRTAACAVEDVQGFALENTGASRTLGGCMMVQDAIDTLLRQKIPTWVDSAEPAVQVAFERGELAQSGAKV